MSVIASAKTAKNPAFVKYRPPDILLKMGRTRFRRALLNSGGKKIGNVTHCSSHMARRSFPYYRIIVKNDKHTSDLLSEEAKLTPEEFALVAGK